MDTDCIFCKIVAGDIPADILFQDEDLLAFNDINPQAPKHFLVIPKRHIAGPAAVTAADQGLMGKLMHTAAELAREQGLTDGFRFVINNGESAGQTVFHIHLHVLGGRDMTWPPG
jgi:histidine triad (HIT) family protein